MQKIAIFADVQNIYYTCREAYGRQFNYRELMRRIGSTDSIVRATAYAIARDDEGQKKFQTALRGMGFEVRLKPFIQRSDGSAKGDWDVGIAIDVLEAAADVDAIVLLSGDGDFDLLLQHVREKYSTKTEVYGVPALTANALIDSADTFNAISSDLLL